VLAVCHLHAGVGQVLSGVNFIIILSEAFKPLDRHFSYWHLAYSSGSQPFWARGTPIWLKKFWGTPNSKIMPK